MSLQTTVPPRRPSSTANAAPMPLPAPVTTARAPALVAFLCRSLSRGPNIAQTALSTRSAAEVFRLSGNESAMNRLT